MTSFQSSCHLLGLGFNLKLYYSILKHPSLDLELLFFISDATTWVKNKSWAQQDKKSSSGKNEERVPQRHSF